MRIVKVWLGIVSPQLVDNQVANNKYKRIGESQSNKTAGAVVIATRLWLVSHALIQHDEHKNTRANKT